MPTLPDAASRDLDVRGNRLPSPPFPRRFRVLDLPVSRRLREVTWLVPDGLLLCCVPWDSEEKRMASLLQVPCGDGYAA